MKKIYCVFKKSALLSIVLILALSSFGTIALGESGTVWTKVFHGGLERELCNKPFISNSELYLPLREIMNLCGVPDNDISYANGKVRVLFNTNPDIPVTAEMNVNQNGISFDKDLEYDIIGIENTRSTTHPLILENGTSYIPLGMLSRIKNYYISTNYESRTYLNLLGDLEIWQYATVSEIFPSGRYDVVLSSPIDVSGNNKYDPKTYYCDGEDCFIGTISEFEERNFTHTEINGYYYPTNAYKCILVDDNNKVITVIPYENFRHEAVNPTLLGVSRWEIARDYINDFRSGFENSLFKIPQTRGGLNVCQNILRTKQDGTTYYYSLPYCFVDFRYIVK